VPLLKDGNPKTGIRGRLRPLISMMAEGTRFDGGVQRKRSRKPIKRKPATKRKAPTKKQKPRTTKKRKPKPSKKVPAMVMQYAKKMAEQTGLSVKDVLKSKPVQSYWKKIAS
jgi:hypothetical protein